MSPWSFVLELTDPEMGFLVRALVVSVLSALTCGVIGTHMVLRGLAFVGDAMAHAVFPGVAVSFLVGGSYVFGGLAAALVVAVVVGVLSSMSRLGHDTVIALAFVTAFAVGLVLISRSPGYTGALSQVLFGSLAGVSRGDVTVAAVTGGLVLGGCWLMHGRIVSVSLDRDVAQAVGIRASVVDVVLYALIALSVVVAARSMGNILVLSLLVAPAAAARMLTDQLVRMMAISALLGAAASVVGIYVSWSLDLPVGGSVVLVLAAVFVLAAVLGPRHGLLGAALARRGEAT